MIAQYSRLNIERDHRVSQKVSRLPAEQTQKREQLWSAGGSRLGEQDGCPTARCDEAFYRPCDPKSVSQKPPAARVSGFNDRSSPDLPSYNLRGHPGGATPLRTQIQPVESRIEIVVHENDANVSTNGTGEKVPCLGPIDTAAHWRALTDAAAHREHMESIIRPSHGFDFARVDRADNRFRRPSAIDERR
jgi:hypothetical protein